MITIPLQLSNDLARRVLLVQDRLPEIIELGLRGICDLAASIYWTDEIVGELLLVL